MDMTVYVFLQKLKVFSMHEILHHNATPRGIRRYLLETSSTSKEPSRFYPNKQKVKLLLSLHLSIFSLLHFS